MVKKRSISWLFVGILIFSFAFQINYNGQMQTNFQNSPDSFLQTPISLGGDGEDGEGGGDGDYEPPHAILNDPLNSLGEIEIISMDLPADPPSDNFSPVSSNIINYTHSDPIFMGTIANASAERAIGEDDPRTSNVTFQISESVIWAYNESAAEYIVGFTPVLQTAFLQKMYFNGTELNPSEYSENSTDEGVNKTNTFYYDFYDNYAVNNKDEFNLTYVYNIIFPITQWSVTNTEDTTQYMSDTNETFTQEFSYHVSFGVEYSQINTLARLNIYLPNHQDIFEPVLGNYNNETIPSDQYFLTDNILIFSNKTDLAAINSLDLTFKAKFTVEMLEVVDGLWSEDRLIERLNVRERDYKITITDGPANLIMKNIGINDTGIYYDHLNNGEYSGRSALSRQIYIENLNTSTGHENFTNVPIPVFIDGITFLHNVDPNVNEPYWLLKNEVDIITIEYTAVYDLSIVLMDKISTPVEGYSVKLFIGDILYGTKINNYTIMPFPMLSSDENGEIIFHSVPVADYTIEIYNKNGIYLENATVTPLEEINNVVTNIPHYPVTILLYTGISVAFILIGYIIFKKNS